MSVRGERIVYRERDREVDRETSYNDAPKRTYTTVKRYQVPDKESSRSILHLDDEVKEDNKQIVIRKERRDPSAQREDVQYRVTERIRERDLPPREEVDYRVTERIREYDRELPPQRRDIQYRVLERDSDRDRSSGARSEFRVIERDREVRAPSPPQAERVREWRFERERDFSPPRARVWERERERPFDVEKYSKSTEYFSQPQQIIIREAAPQPIIIREERREPIIIREERREPQYEFIEREEVRDESKSLVSKKEEPPPPSPAPPSEAPTQKTSQTKPEEENYFYERRVRQIDRGPQRRDDSYERRSEVRPRDSASQYSSDDSYEYVRRERTYDDDRSRSRERDESPHHKRHLAEGAIAGVGVAEILRHHRKSQGQATGGRAVNDLAGAAIGAIGAEAVSRVRSRRRSSRDRDRSPESDYDSRYDRRDRRKRSRSRSKSLSRAQQLGGLAAVAAVGALAGYALTRNKNKETVVVEPPHRSRSRRRRASVDSYYTDDRTVLSDGGGRAMDPNHRNTRIAQAGLATAAAAGIWDHVRSKSRGASGLGGAALAGLYERNKANKEAEKAAIIEDERHRGRRRRSRSRSRSVPAPYPDDDRSVDHGGYIAYGNDPIYSEPGRGYYSDDEPGRYQRRHRGGSDDGSSPDTRRRRSRSRHLAETGAAAGAAAVAAHEMGKRRERSRQRDEQQRHGQEGYQDQYGYGHDQDYPDYHSAQQPGGYLPADNAQQYPNSHYFPPPPTGEYATARGEPAAAEQSPYPAYNPADYAQSGPQPHQPYGQLHGAYNESDANLGAPYPNDTFAGDTRYDAPPAAAHHERGRGREPPENVSAPTQASAERELPDAGTFHVPAYELTDATGQSADAKVSADGVETPQPGRSRSQSRVRFNLGANTAHSPEAVRSYESRHTDSETSGDHKHRRRRRKHREDHARKGNEHTESPNLMHDQYEREPDQESEGTIELPDRFDEHGNRKPVDPLAQGITRILGEAGLADILGRLTGGGQDDGDGRSGRRRRR
ncbi:hypothetical protein BAUCODRAFT_576848 [Baudoinia panamericana UAMH 10762]|uniref:DUF3824 domain-containing protein n=1 Tax=Baudoinia panamericana (strain UAMH 10762) TaxID=717646 RepID=M2MVN7_BAUPA|nr:uncharacterized protein BAUCODRAFT_576848 [Baudoinia panamericana UAMH 10762]EMC95628.1 hypothetical protein BAUCODRAFT_576848 [Baudoinia panamericana UAMH 10762]